jgi:hypothetical protein
MTLLAHLRTHRLDRDAAFDAAVRGGSLPSPERCPHCGQVMPAGESATSSALATTSALATGEGSPAPAAPASREPSVDEELAALSNGRPVRQHGHPREQPRLGSRRGRGAE